MTAEMIAAMTVGGKIDEIETVDVIERPGVVCALFNSSTLFQLFSICVMFGQVHICCV